MATITDGITVVTLPDDLIWIDEFETSQIAQESSRTLSGSLVVFEGVKIKGRSMNLASDDDSGWINRLDLIALRALFEQVDETYTLNFNGTDYTVIADKSNGSAIRAVAVIDCSDPTNDSKYALSLRLFTA
jgi:hypothetical protein